jgi:hypothetical protein
MITPDKAIEALQNRLEALNNVYNAQKFSEWKTRTMQTLAHLYGENHTSYSALNEIHAYNYVERTENAKSEANELLNGLIEDLQNFGFPKLNEATKNGVNVQVNQHNNQTTTVSLDINIILNIIRDELRNSEIEEIKEILESNLEPKEKKKTIIDKIKSFGSDVATNILANLLANPKVYEQLGGML